MAGEIASEWLVLELKASIRLRRVSTGLGDGGEATAKMAPAHTYQVLPSRSGVHSLHILTRYHCIWAKTDHDERDVILLGHGSRLPSAYLDVI